MKDAATELADVVEDDSDDDGFRDSWVCPRCYRIDLDLTSHLAHLKKGKRCMAKTLAPGRGAGACHCIGPGRPVRKSCACSYRKRR